MFDARIKKQYELKADTTITDEQKKEKLKELSDAGRKLEKEIFTLEQDEIWKNYQNRRNNSLKEKAAKERKQ